MSEGLEGILHPDRFVTRDDAVSPSSPIPRSSGVYGWYFDLAPPGVPIDRDHRLDDWVLLYVGISPRRPRRSDGRASAGHIRKRIQTHYTRDASRSTLRLSLGTLLSADLELFLRPTGSSKRLTFGDGERVISEWMAAHTRVCWVEHREPWLVEEALIAAVPLKLNLDGNASGDLYRPLKAARKAQRDLVLKSSARAADDFPV